MQRPGVILDLSNNKAPFIEKDNLGSDKPLSAEGRPFIKVRGLFTVQKDIAFAGRASEERRFQHTP
jgi:hypothetical protein